MKHIQTEGVKRDWKTYNSLIPNDGVNEWCAELVCRFAFNGGARHEHPVEILLVTGRPEECRNDTAKWLWEHKISWDVLFMRRTGDYRFDDVVKCEIYEREIRDKFEVLFCIDDKTSVVRMYREEFGLTVLQCEDNDRYNR